LRAGTAPTAISYPSLRNRPFEGHSRRRAPHKRLQCRRYRARRAAGAACVRAAGLSSWLQQLAAAAGCRRRARAPAQPAQPVSAQLDSAAGCSSGLQKACARVRSAGAACVRAAGLSSWACARIRAAGAACVRAAGLTSAATVRCAAAGCRGVRVRPCSLQPGTSKRAASLLPDWALALSTSPSAH
jgi:hypothetical protein